jgi:hypothetical protein
MSDALESAPVLTTQMLVTYVLWFWFMPFVTLVGQTLDALLQHAPGLSPTLFSQGRKQDLARTLDGADFVHWWHRNLDKKPYAVHVVRAEHEHYF